MIFFRKLKFRKLLVGVPLLCSIIFITVAVIADWIGLSSKPGFGKGETRMLIIGLEFLLIGSALFFLRRHVKDYLVEDFISEKITLLNQFIRLRLRTLNFVLTLFLTSAIIATLYVFAIRSSGTEFFYEPTTVIKTRFDWLIIYPYGVFFGVVIVLVYAIFRLGMGRILSTVGALFIMVSSIHLYNLVPSIYRDYAKAPFILAVILIMGLLLTLPLKRSRLFFLSFIGGFISGAGFWVRDDMLILPIIFILLLLFFTPGSLRTNINARIIAVILFCTSFVFTALPNLFYHQAGGGSISAVAGLMTAFDERLGIRRSIYDWGYLYADDFNYAISYAHSKVIAPDKDFSYAVNEHNRVGANYFLKVAINFPADMLIRIYASVLKILELPFMYTAPPPGVTNKLVLMFSDLRANILSLLAGSGLFLSIATMLMISAHNLRIALFYLLVLIFLAGYPALQFQGRHYFHLEFITWWNLGFVIQHAGVSLEWLLKNIKSNGIKKSFLTCIRSRWWTTVYVRRVIGFGIGLLIILVIPVYVLRQYQSRHVTNLLKGYINAEKEYLPLVRQTLSYSTVLITDPDKFKPPKEGSVSVDFLVAEFNLGKCGYSVIEPILRYEYAYSEGRDRISDFSRAMEINLIGNGTKTKIFFPAVSYNQTGFANGPVYFKGVEMLNNQASCMQGLYRIKDPSQFPILLTVLLSTTWERADLYHKFTAWEIANIHTAPNSLSDKSVKDILSRNVRPINKKDIALLDPIVSINGSQWIIRGHAKNKLNRMSFLMDRNYSVLTRALFVGKDTAKLDTDLMLTKNRWLKRGNYFVVQGELYAGGATFGIIKDNVITIPVSITNRGPFTIIIETPEDGFYKAGMANDIDVYTSLENRIVITKAGWIDSDSYK